MPGTQSTPQSELEKQLAEEAKNAVHRKAIAEARASEANADKAAAEAQKIAMDNERQKFKGPDVKAPEGKLTATGNFIETEILANKSLSVLTADLVGEIETHPNFKNKNLAFVIYHTASFPAIELYLGTIAQLDSLKELLAGIVAVAIDAINESPNDDAAGGADPLTIGITAAGIIRTVADVFSLFKTNTAYTNYELAADENLVVSAFAEVVGNRNTGWKIYYPAVYPVNMFSGTANSAYTLLFNEVKKESNKATGLQKILETQVVTIDEQLLLETDESKKKLMRKRKERLNNIILSLQSTVTTFTQFEASLMTTAQDTKISMQTVILQAERLTSLLKATDTFVIKLSAKRNGSTMVKESLFFSAKAFHSGGCQLNCLIFGSDGNILYSYNSNKYFPIGELAI